MNRLLTRVFHHRFVRLARVALLMALAVFTVARVASAQGVTTGSITGVVLDAQKRPVVGASVVAIHLPSGTNYETVTREDGRFIIPNMRVGGPYSVVVGPNPGGLAFQAQTADSVMVSLGNATDLSFNVQPMVKEQINVTAQTDPVFNSERTGAATTVSRDQLAKLPTVSGRLNDMTRLTPQSGGTLSFAGTDSRLNNITVDGSYFNNSFGLRNSPGDTSGVAPISLAAIEELQVSIAPYDVRQGNFVGAQVNTVTRSGGNTWRASFYDQFRNDSVVGTLTHGNTFNPGTFNFRNTGLWGSGPIIKNKLFIFGSYENESFIQPGTTFVANTNGGLGVGGNVTRVLASDLDTLSSFLKTKYNYDTGPYQGYDNSTPAKRYLFKGDYNLNDHNKMVVRYNQLDSYTDNLVSNSNSVGNGNRRTSTDALSFQNSDYKQLENIKSIVGEWNSVIGTNMANNMLIGWTSQNENRGYYSTWFPLVDILKDGTTYTSFGFEPFTPNNELTYKTFQIQNNFTEYAKSHALTFGLALEKYKSINVFNSAAQSVYTYNSLADFYTDVAGYEADPNRTSSPVALKFFDLRWNNIPGQEKPVQPLSVLYLSAYIQDNWRVRDRLSMDIGLRWDAPRFADTGFDNAQADLLTFRDEFGNPVQYNTGKLPDSNPLWSPRVGLNWDVKGDHSLQVRGGSGIFGGKPAYVWISNQIGNTGVLTGFEHLSGTKLRPWNPNPDTYKPTNVTGAPASSYLLELIDNSFKFPQVWRTNAAVDKRLPWGLLGTVEYIYNRDLNGIYYINANLPAAQSAFTGADNRPRWTNQFVNAKDQAGNTVQTVVVLKNEDVGRAWNFAATLEKQMHKGLWIKGFWSYGQAKNTIDPGSIATGSFRANAISGDPNLAPLAYSSASPGHRFFVTGSYTRNYFSFGATTVAMVWESRTISNTSYTFAADANGDGATNDLIYIPRDQSEMNFVTYKSTVTGITYTAAQQAAAWDAYINQDRYLSQHRGEYAQRNAVFLPFVHRADFSASQDVTFKVGGTRHTVQFRWDVDNFTNLLDSNWGASSRIVSNTPLTNPGIDATTGAMNYRFREVNGALMNHTFERTAGTSDVYRMMFTIRYTF